MIARGEDPYPELVVTQRRRGDRCSVSGVVGADAEDSARFGLGDDRGIDFCVVGARKGIPGTFEIPVAVTPCVQRDVRERLDRRRRHRRDHMDVGPAVGQGGQPALHHRARTDDHHLSAGELETYQVMMVPGALGTRLHWA
jgi:hypothetical protein